MKTKKSREKAERELFEEIKALLVIIASKVGVTSEEMGKSLGVGGSAIRNILSGTKHKNKKK